MSSDSFPQRLCLVTAVDLEFKIATELLSEKSFHDNSTIRRGVAGGRALTIFKSGMGAVGFLPRFNSHLQTNVYDGVLIAGFAGALDPRLNVGEAVVYGRSLAADDSRPGIDLDRSFSDQALDRIRRAQLSGQRGNGLTLDRILTRASEKLLLGRQTSAQAVDMETYAIAAYCRQRGTPLAVVRVISDDANSDLPDFQSAFDPEGRIKAVQMARVMLARPARSARFLYNLKLATHSLRRSLQALFTGND